jgi:Tol biopolymer transport system component
MWIAGLDGQGKKRLTIGQYDSSPTWSPDGRRIVFVHSRHGSTRIWMIGASGGGKHAVIRKDTGEQNDPDWSPRGNLIVFSNTRANYGELAGDLLVVRPDGAGLRRLGHAGILPRWSPDGTRLAYLTERAEDDQFDANVLTLRTNRVRRYAIRLNRTAPVWSPDGRTLLVSACLVSTDDCASDASRLRLRDGRLTVLRSFPVGGPADWRR